MQHHSNEQFFSLLRYALGAASSFDACPTEAEWRYIYEQGVRQSVIALLFTAVNRLRDEQEPPLELTMKWATEAEDVRALNALLNSESKRLTDQVTPVNLGWVGDATSGATGYCTYYQWGRKDAFIPSTGTANTNHTVYNISNDDVTTTAFSHTNDNSMTIGTNIQRPTVHNQNSTTSGPCNTKYYNMWDAQQTGTAEKPWNSCHVCAVARYTAPSCFPRLTARYSRNLAAV